MCSFRSKLVEFRFRVVTRFARAEHYRHHRFFAASGCRCDASWRRAQLRVIVGRRSEREVGFMPRSKPQANAIVLRHRRRTF